MFLYRILKRHYILLLILPFFLYAYIHILLLLYLLYVYIHILSIPDIIFALIICFLFNIDYLNNIGNRNITGTIITLFCNSTVITTQSPAYIYTATTILTFILVIVLPLLLEILSSLLSVTASEAETKYALRLLSPPELDTFPSSLSV